MEEPKHGGKRDGAGRKHEYGEATKVLRVPESRIVEIKEYLKKTKKEIEVSDIRQIDPTTHVEIPLAIERVQAGFPSPAQDYIDKKLDLNEHLIHNINATFMVRVNSLSMINIGLDINDELIVDRSLEAKHRDIVIALVDNDFTVKRLMIDGDNRWLKTENPDFQDIHLEDGQEMVIWGVVTRVIKSFR
ncbi:LexA family protein [Acinetobacter entericus]|uniref:Translesion error-prone DNA polymerase V autoproteolytic subunit n=1 Tax=Acinetobacter entericus TaxID=2989714 RepID=A0ABT3NFB2_9GAMM|nr:translesion error-prone DNA polymerase V autoproteolytic subunit [Acinetobacter entericus]MCW8037964.1 translesion error-prone DNA polymerase V autoproteolytic subunit [Acinetobacter entericus]